MSVRVQTKNSAVRERRYECQQSFDRSMLASFCRGVVPFSQRKKMLEKARAKNKKPKSSAGISSIPNITVGTQVRLCFRFSLADTVLCLLGVFYIDVS